MIVEINERQVARVAELLKNLPESGKGLNFYSFMKDGKEIIETDKFPPLNHPQAVNFFFFTAMHDFGFWYGDNKGYFEPLYGKMDGKTCKGSDLLWKVCMKAFNKDVMRFEPYRLFEPCRLSAISPTELARIFSDDNGPVPWPDFGTRFAITRAYARWFTMEKITPKILVEAANKTEEPLQYLLTWLRLVPGYNRDHLEKRNMYLAMALANRPEKFLDVKDPENWKPLVDYHLMRLSLRLGLVYLDKEIQKTIKKREWINFEIEREIRYATFRAVSEIIKKSGRPMSFIDEKMWMARKYCPEMETPECPKCIFTSICKKRIELFQPVYRTTAY